MTIQIYSGETHVGDMSMEGVDEGMGVGTGSFHPSANYREIRAQVVAAANARHQRRPAEGPPLAARTATGETIITGFIQIDDFADVDVDPEIAIQFPDREQLERALRTAV
jgi:hypothetical protein